MPSITIRNPSEESKERLRRRAAQRVRSLEALLRSILDSAAEETTYHEYGAQRLARLVERIAMRRGSPIDAIGASDLAARDDGGTLERLLAADQVVFVRSASTSPRGKEIERSADHLPDVVLEVDYSTDARRRKLGIYESWGFPEIWIEVPDAVWRRRPKNRPPGLTIHLLEGGRYREAASSRAFPTWTAEEIHGALNEPAVSSGTVEVLRRVADALAAREGTGPDDDPMLRRERAEGQERGRTEGRAEGRSEGRAGERLDILRLAHAARFRRIVRRSVACLSFRPRPRAFPPPKAPPISRRISSRHQYRPPCGSSGSG